MAENNGMEFSQCRRPEARNPGAGGLAPSGGSEAESVAASPLASDTLGVLTCGFIMLFIHTVLLRVQISLFLSLDLGPTLTQDDPILT